MKKLYCNVCGLDLFNVNIFDLNQEICPSCKIHFGYDDCAGDDPLRPSKIYKDWRKKWAPNIQKEDYAKIYSQLQNVPQEYRDEFFDELLAKLKSEK